MKIIDYPSLADLITHNNYTMTNVDILPRIFPSTYSWFSDYRMDIGTVSILNQDIIWEMVQNYNDRE